jgi:hypothetical protein
MRKCQRPDNPLKTLFESLDQRIRPEDAAYLVREILSENGVKLGRKEKGLFQRATRYAWGHSSMDRDFARPVGFEKQLKVAKQLFPDVPLPDPNSPISIAHYASQAGERILKTYSYGDFKHNRFDRNERKGRGIGEISKRQYNKLFRFLARIDKKNERLMRELQKRDFTQISKSRFANRITWEEFSSDIMTACFIGYYTARCGLRSAFLAGPQQRPYDELADALFQRLEGGANWYAIAHVYPNQEVLKLTTDEQKGKLLGLWYKKLGEIAQLLREVWDDSDINPKTMIVKRGNDSSTWNATAGAWNKARNSWINFVYALNMDKVLDEVCPGKVLRLMAADVAYWHKSKGGELEPDTQVWISLPLPWEVLAGEKTCTRQTVEAACEKAKIKGKGWIAPHEGRVIEDFRPTPELVHGVAVSSPQLAEVIKKAGWFSGKGTKAVDIEEVEVSRDEHGFATGVK